MTGPVFAVSGDVLIPAAVVVVAALIAAAERITLSRRSRGLEELEQAWTHRGDLVVAMRERLEWEALRGDRCDERLAATTARLIRVEASVGLAAGEEPAAPPLPPPPPLPPVPSWEAPGG